MYFPKLLTLFNECKYKERTLEQLRLSVCLEHADWRGLYRHLLDISEHVPLKIGDGTDGDGFI